MLLSIYFTGCIQQEADNTEGIFTSQENDVKNDIREIAYQYLGEADKATLIDYENAEVEEYRCAGDHYVASLNGHINLKDKDTYKVTFNTSNDALLGPIIIYLDKTSYSVLGIDLRD